MRMFSVRFGEAEAVVAMMTGVGDIFSICAYIGLTR